MSEMSDRSTLSILILAGGRSQRMGTDKAAIRVPATARGTTAHSVPMLRKIYDVAAECCALQTAALDTSPNWVYVVTPWAERYRSILPIECQFIPEPQPDCGPLMGFRQGLVVVRSQWVLLLACDLPNLSAPVVREWIERLVAVPAGSMAYLPSHPAKGWEPLCGFYRRTCLESLQAYTAAGGRSFQGWLAQQPVTELHIADRTCLINCNTPADLAAVVEQDREIELK
jgi:molybdenum cofactor guanylyltransferase